MDTDIVIIVDIMVVTETTMKNILTRTSLIRTLLTITSNKLAPRMLKPSVPLLLLNTLS